MNKLELYEGGFPLATETLDFLQGQSHMAATLTALGGSDTYILSGVATQGGNVTDGMIVYKGEILPFTGGAIQTQVTITEVKQQVTYQVDDDGDGLGDNKSAYVRRAAKFGNDGVETFSFSELKPFIQGVANQMFETFFKDVRLPYVGAIEDIPVGWELCEILSGHFPVVYDPSNPDYNLIGKTGGADSRVLTQAQMPTHNHSGTTTTAGSHSHSGNTTTNGNHSHTSSVSNSGAHSHSGNTTSSGYHSHSYKDSYFIEAYSPVQDQFSSYSSENVGSNFHGSGDSDRDNSRIWYRNRRTVGDGSHTHYFNISNSGAHSHSVNIVTNGGHNHSLNINNDGNHSHSFTTGQKGNSQAFDNRPRYKVIALIKYVGLDPVS